MSNIPEPSERQKLPRIDECLSSQVAFSIYKLGYGNLEDLFKQVISIHAPGVLLEMEGIGPRTIAMLIAIYNYYKYDLPPSYNVWYNSFIKTEDGEKWLKEYKAKAQKESFSFMKSAPKTTEAYEKKNKYQEFESLHFVRVYVVEHSMNPVATCEALDIEFRDAAHARAIAVKHWNRLTRLGKLDQLLDEVGLDVRNLKTEVLEAMRKHLHNEDAKIGVQAGKALLPFLGKAEEAEAAKENKSIPKDSQKALEELISTIARVLPAAGVSFDEFTAMLNNKINGIKAA